MTLTICPQLLTHKWHELLVLATCASAAKRQEEGGEERELEQEINASMSQLANCLDAMMGKERERITWAQLEAEAGALIGALVRARVALRRVTPSKVSQLFRLRLMTVCLLCLHRRSWCV